MSSYFVVFQNCSGSSKNCAFPHGNNKQLGNFYRKPAENMTGIVLNLQVNLSRTDTLTVSHLPIYECGGSFHLFQVFLNFSVMFYSSVYRSYICLVKFIPKYFMSFFYYKQYFCQFHISIFHCDYIEIPLIFAQTLYSYNLAEFTYSFQ